MVKFARKQDSYLINFSLLIINLKLMLQETWNVGQVLTIL